MGNLCIFNREESWEIVYDSKQVGDNEGLLPVAGIWWQHFPMNLYEVENKCVIVGISSSCRRN